MLVAAATIAGCGSDSNTGGAANGQPSGPLKKAAFIKKVGVICEQGLKEKEQAVNAGLAEYAQAKKSLAKDEVGEFFEATVFPSYREIVHSMEQLDPPQEGAAEAEKVIGELKAALQALETAPVKSAGHNPFLVPDKALREYGVKNCPL